MDNISEIAVLTVDIGDISTRLREQIVTDAKFSAGMFRTPGGKRAPRTARRTKLFHLGTPPIIVFAL